MHGEFKVPRGKLVVVDLDIDEASRLTNVRLSGDFFLYPEEAMASIVSALDGAPAGLPAHEYALRVAEAVPPGAELFGFSPAAIAIAVTRAQEADADA
ncbi:MAG: biotin--protein ligase [Chloroflexota bacterium]|nr:biotin--protein ligase [Chloroflexota bacterium]